MEKEEKQFSKNYIVGIGASAGGLEALQKFLSVLPSDTGFPYIIVQHLSPDYKSLLSEILAKYTAMPVVQVVDGMEVKPNTVYVIQPGKLMRISKGKLYLSSQIEHELNLPIDMFFRSLADEAGSLAIAVILSGTGSDGSNGIKNIKENDGMIIVQNPDSSKFDGMPRSAIRTGLVDAQLTPEEIALELQHISGTTKQGMISAKTEKEIDEELMKKIYFILKKVSNINFIHYKQTTILRRIERRMMLIHKDTLSEYVDHLYENFDEVKILSKEVLIGVTSFFRDPEFFLALKEKAVQNILLHSTPDEAIRIWVAGCSTGEEAYSIAILFCEMMETLKLKRTIKIFATDLDVEAVTIAGKGIYSESIIDSVSSLRLSRYFTRRGNTYEINRTIRKMIVFSPHNVFQDPPFGRLDLISCRNMLIYFQPVLQNDLFAIFHTALKDGGYLFLGKSEAIGAYTEAFPVVDVAAKIFSHRSEIKISGSKVVPYLQTRLYDDEYFDYSSDTSARSVFPNEVDKNEEDVINVELLEKFMPACLLVNEKNELVHTFGENSNYIHFSVGKVSNGLYDVLTEALKIPVSTLLKEARDGRKLVQCKDICFKGEKKSDVINLSAMPLNRKGFASDTLYAIVFSENSQRGEIPEAVPYEIDSVASQHITDLEQSLRDVQNRLSSSVSEQECVNEELQAANEELLTANEELQSSNEELQSVNEELYTVNTEYQQKLTELADLNDDIANFLSSTLIGIIFVDNKLSIRRYTDYVASEFSVMDHDIGRSLRFISYHFPTVDIIELCDNVLKTLVPDEREVTTGKNKVFFMRIAPYRTTENKILGCVITLVDVTMQKQGLDQLKSTEQQLTIVQQASEAKSDFMSKIAHEIKTPVNALFGLTEIAKSQLENKDALSNSLMQMTDMIKYMNSIVEDILEMSQQNVDGALAITEPFSIIDAINGVVAIINPRAKEKKLTFDIDIAKTLDMKFFGSKTRVQQVIINFLNNAVKYTKEGGKISLKAYEEASVGDQIGVCFEIEDTGIGIGEDFLPKLFTPFERELRDDSAEASGMGLGLSIAYNIIKDMKGDVVVRSTVDVGTKFIIRIILEKCTGDKNVPQRKKKAVHSDLEGLHVLIADDNAMNRQIVASLVIPKGVTFDEAVDGKEALKKFVEMPAKTYDCILMDIRMPNMDGIEATRLIRDSKKEDAHSVPIIGISANGFAEDVKKASDAGIDRYTIKPIDPEKLFEVILSLVNRGKRK